MHIQPTNGTVSSNFSQGTQNAGLSSRAEASDKLSGARICYNPNKTEKVEMPDAEYNETLKNHYNSKPGFFNLYTSKDEKVNETLLEIKPDQINKLFLSSTYRKTGCPLFKNFVADTMLRNGLVYFKQSGMNILFFAKSTDAHTSDTNFSGAIERSGADAFLGSASIKYLNFDKGNIIIDLKELLIKDVENLLQAGLAKNEFELDEKASNFTPEALKSHEKNTEIGTQVIYKNKNTKGGIAINYNFSFSELPPEGSYKRRNHNPSVGYFTTSSENCDKDAADNRKEQYIQRWNLGKLEPIPGEPGKFKPEKPIVYWIAKSVPKEYRKAIETGVLFWNKAFEKIGIKDAIVVKQQPDNSDWDSSDITRNTINFTHTEETYGMGPSHVDPRTGEIYAADIILSRRRFDTMREEMIAFDEKLSQITDKEEREKYIETNLMDFMVLFSMHEVGHTLGLSHNFKGSTKQTNGRSASVMDYNPGNYTGNGQMWQTELGEYDYSAIAFGYTPVNAETRQQEDMALDPIIKKMQEENIPFGRDEDEELDPSCNGNLLRDRGNPLESCKETVQMVYRSWKRLETEFKKPDAEYDKLKERFDIGWKYYKKAVKQAYKYIGGIYYRRGNPDDLAGKSPYEPVSAQEQKEALKFLFETIFSKMPFDFSPELLNALDLDIKGKMADLQKEMLNDIFSVDRLKRLYNNEERYKENEFKVSDLFEVTANGIWSEIFDSQAKEICVCKDKQTLQKLYIDKLLIIARGQLSATVENNGQKTTETAPVESVIQAKETLEAIRDRIKVLLNQTEIKVYKSTKNYLEWILSEIKI